ncbi:hypothetical protein [Accumulibacter sp.]|jgi:hypothetical protein|uniref:hypothetical protein n=1 Tax=Accumulibacter sp. TaxID=2053492 RepID=UPI001AC3C540|nr:hypothetical protein [Accumulibacter sp.]MBN8452714.1 hypothetical protein [Accumulibacter sp.]
MTEQVNWSYAVQVSGGPTLVGAGMRPVDGYVKLSLTVPAHGTQSIEVMPGAGGAVQVLVIAPAKPSDKLTYQLDGNDVPLDGPHVLIGAGAVSLLAAMVGTLSFDNGTDEDAAIDILAGRDSTP